MGHPRPGGPSQPGRHLGRGWTGQGRAAGRLRRSRHSTAQAFRHTQPDVATCVRWVGAYRRVRAGCRRRLPDRLLLCRRPLPPVCRGVGAGRLCRRHRVPEPRALQHGGPFRRPPLPASRAHGLDRNGGAAAGGRVLPQDRARLLPRLARLVVRERRRRPGRLPRRDRGPDAARPGRGPPDAARHRVRHRARLREPAAGARCRPRQRHPRLRRVRRPRHRAGEPEHCRPCQPRQPRCADGLLPAQRQSTC